MGVWPPPPPCCAWSPSPALLAGEEQTKSFSRRISFLPSPLRGGSRRKRAKRVAARGWGSGGPIASAPLRHLWTPTPNPSPQGGGELQTNKFVLATRPAPEFCQPPSHERRSFRNPPPAAHDPEKWSPVFGQDHAPKKGGEAPKGACQPSSAPHGRGSALIAARSPSGASPRHSPGRSQPALAQLQTRAS